MNFLKKIQKMQKELLIVITKEKYITEKTKNELLKKYENNPKSLLTEQISIFGNKKQQKKVLKEFIKNINISKKDILKIDKINKEIIFLLNTIKKQQINNNNYSDCDNCNYCNDVMNKELLQYIIWNYDNIYKKLEKINFCLKDFLIFSRNYNIVNIILMEDTKILQINRKYLDTIMNTKIKIYTKSMKLYKNNFPYYPERKIIQKLKNNEILLAYNYYEMYFGKRKNSSHIMNKYKL